MDYSHCEKLGVSIAGRAIVLGLLDGPKPVFARVNGDAIGLGASLALENLTLRSNDVKEGVSAFLERRKAVFMGT